MQGGVTSARGKRICLVTGELAGPFYNGGIGTTNRAMAIVLAQLGYQVDILYTHVSENVPLCLRGTFEEHVDAFARLNVRLLCIRNRSQWHDWPMRSFQALEYLRKNFYHIVFFDDMDGTAYYPLLARKTGCAELATTIMCVTAHSSTEWIFDLNGKPIETFELLRLNEMERRSLELSDIVKAPSSYILRKYRNFGWDLSRCVVLPNFISSERQFFPVSTRQRIHELVFFGRLEERKGLWMFCRALERMKAELRGSTVTFLGKMTEQVGETLIKRSLRWPFRIQIINSYNQVQAISYLKKPGRLAVMASVEDNSPSTIFECLEENIPFVAAKGSGGEELLDIQTRERNLFEPTAEGLHVKLQSALTDGVWTGRPAVGHAELMEMWANWLAELKDCEENGGRIEPAIQNETKLVIFIPAEQSRAQLEQTLVSIEIAKRKSIDLTLLVKGSLSIECDPQLLASFKSSQIQMMSSFGELMNDFAQHSDTSVCICSTQTLPETNWIERGRYALATDAKLAAVTGMISDPRAHKDSEPRASYFVQESDMVPERLLTGNAAALLALALDTNCGFILMRASACKDIAEISAEDVLYDRPRSTIEFVHACLVVLKHRGERFEVIPDVLCGPLPGESGFEVFRAGELMRSLPADFYGYAPGTDAFRLASLAVDAGLNRERNLAHRNYLRIISQRVGYDLSSQPLYLPENEHRLALSRLALASGQVDLAIDIAAKLGIQESTINPLSIRQYIDDATTDQVINVIEALGRGFEKIGNAEYELWAPSDGRKITVFLTEDSKGRTSLLLRDVDLSRVTLFTTIIGSAEEDSEPMRFRVEFVSGDQAHYESFEKVLRGGQEIKWDVAMPVGFEDGCSLSIGVEWVWGDTRSRGKAIWFNPRFLAI